MNQQRELIYKQRNQVLDGDELKPKLIKMLEDNVCDAIDLYLPDSVDKNEWNVEGLKGAFMGWLTTPDDFADGISDRDETRLMLIERGEALYAKREEELGKLMPLLERKVLLDNVDAKWMDHLDAMDQMRQGIGLQAIGNENPLFQYQKEALEMFNALMDDIQATVCRICLYADLIEQMEERTDLVTNRDENGAVKRTPVKKEQTVGRNDYCPCGSGKKYKKCCGANK